MKRFLKPLILLPVSLSLTACLEQKSTESTTDEASSLPGHAGTEQKSQPACTVTQVSGGAQIQCGETTAFLAHGIAGADGTQGVPGAIGATGPVGPRGPMGSSGEDGTSARLINGDGTVIGDRVISFKPATGYDPNVIVTVWDATTNTIASYMNGVVSDGDGSGTFYITKDCTGLAYYLKNINSASFDNEVVYRVGQLFKRTRQTRRNMFSYKSASGVCHVEEYADNRLFSLLTPIVVDIPHTLKPGWSITYQ